jgi:hypothetical protein
MSGPGLGLLGDVEEPAECESPVTRASALMSKRIGPRRTGASRGFLIATPFGTEVKMRRRVKKLPVVKASWK